MKFQYFFPIRVVFLLLLTTVCNCCSIKKKVPDAPTCTTTSLPFEIKNANILVKVKFGKSLKTLRTLIFDTAAPMAGDSSIVFNPAIKATQLDSNHTILVHSTSFSTTKHLIDSIYINDVLLRQVQMINLINQHHIPNKIKYSQGILGVNILKQGIWEVDFKKKEILFTVCKDSIPFIERYKELPSYFDEKTGFFYIDLIIEGKKINNLLVDMGGATAIEITKNEFNLFDTNHNATIRNGTMYLMSGVYNTNFYYLLKQKIKIGDQVVEVAVLTSDITKQKLAGCLFFGQFSRVVFDYINKKILVET
jgi:hypothetical protein